MAGISFLSAINMVYCIQDNQIILHFAFCIFSESGVFMELLTKASRSDAVTDRERENLQVAYRAACEGVVLLKNDGALPLASKRVALYGPGASMTIKGGTGSGEVNERHSVTILEGLKNRGFTVTTEDWIADFETFYAEAEAAYRIEKRKRVNLLKPGSIMQMLGRRI